jgi:hypothetical protein
MRIAIAGPGRSGTSVLVRILQSWGLSVPEGPWHEDAAAGLEAKLGSRPDLEVEKDPWAFEYIDRLDPAVLASYSAFIVPVRRRQDAALSRSVQERVHRALHGVDDTWAWDTWGTVPGGAVVESTAEAVSASLGRGLWDLLEIVASAGLQPIILQFPRFVEDFDYLWDQLGPVVSERVDRETAQREWSTVVEPSKVTISAARDGNPEIDELRAMVDKLSKAARQASSERDAAVLESAQLRIDSENSLAGLGAQLDAERQRSESLELDLSALRDSRSWRFTRPLRALRGRRRP